MADNCSNSPPPTGRWFQFRLRSLLIAVAVLAVVCAWVERQRKWIGERNYALSYAGPDCIMPGLSQFNFSFYGQNPKAPTCLWLFGESAVEWLVVNPNRVEEARRLFPEATIHLELPH